MQFAFSYFYFLINERREWDWAATFKEHDSDGSGFRGGAGQPATRRAARAIPPSV